MPPPTERPQTRHQKEQATRAAALRQHDKHQRFTLAGGLIGTLAAAALTGYIIATNRPIEPTTSWNPTATGMTTGQGSPTPEFLHLPDSQVILNEISRRNIRENREEQNLWTRANEQLASNREANDVGESLRRVNLVTSFMEASKNPQFIKTIAFFEELQNKGDLSFFPNQRLPADETGVFAVVPRIHNGKIHWVIEWNVREVVATQNIITLGFLLSHEAEHVKNAIAFQESLPKNTTVEERLARENIRTNRSQNRQELIAEEARGKAAEVEAFIESQGLLRWPTNGLSLVHDAVTYIRFGKNPSDPRWQNYVRTIYKL